MMTKYNSLTKEEQAKEIRSLMRLFDKIDMIVNFSEDSNNLEMISDTILSQQKNIRKQIKHFTRLFNDEIEG